MCQQTMSSQKCATALAEQHWKKKYDDLMLAYIKLEEKNYALKASVDLLKDVALENGKAG